MIAMLIFASMLWGDGTFFDHDTMRTYDATNQASLDELVRRRRAFWKLDAPRPVRQNAWSHELGLPLLPSVKEDRLGE